MAGIFDGEGCLYFKTSPPLRCYEASAFIVNTDIGILQEARRILQALDIYYVEVKRATKNKTLTRININRRLEIEVFLRTILPHLRSTQKTVKAKEFLEFAKQHHKHCWGEATRRENG